LLSDIDVRKRRETKTETPALLLSLQSGDHAPLLLQVLLFEADLQHRHPELAQREQRPDNVEQRDRLKERKEKKRKERRKSTGVCFERSASECR
jgi:hypothetical protein